MAEEAAGGQKIGEQRPKGLPVTLGKRSSAGEAKVLTSEGLEAELVKVQQQLATR